MIPVVGFLGIARELARRKAVNPLSFFFSVPYLISTWWATEPENQSISDSLERSFRYALARPSSEPPSRLREIRAPFRNLWTTYNIQCRQRNRARCSEKHRTCRQCGAIAIDLRGPVSQEVARRLRQNSVGQTTRCIKLSVDVWRWSRTDGVP